MEMSALHWHLVLPPTSLDECWLHNNKHTTVLSITAFHNAPQDWEMKIRELTVMAGTKNEYEKESEAEVQ